MTCAPATGRVLVVDDDRVNRTLLTRRLEREGHRVIAADNGETALALLREDAPTGIATLRDAAARGDAPAVRRLAHSLKSNGATFGAQAFAGVCRELESLARGGELNRASTLLTRAEETWGAVRRALEAVRAAGEAR